jgi:hypothetical protein
VRRLSSRGVWLLVFRFAIKQASEPDQQHCRREIGKYSS